MSQNVLQLNENMSEITLSGPLKSGPILQKHLGSLSTNVNPADRNQGVIFDSDLLFEKQVAKVNHVFINRGASQKSGLFSLEKVTHACISSRFQCCYSPNFKV